MPSVDLSRKPAPAPSLPSGPQLAIRKVGRIAYRRDSPDSEWVAIDYDSAPIPDGATSIGHAKIGPGWHTVYPATAG